MSKKPPFPPKPRDVLVVLFPGFQIIDAAGPDAHIVLLALHGMVEQVDYSGGLGNQLLALALGKKPEAAVAAPDALRRLRDLMPDSVHRAIWRRLPGPLRAARQGALSSIGGDLAHDPVFRIAHDGHLGLRMNLEGRERDGRFGPGAAEAALAVPTTTVAAANRVRSRIRRTRRDFIRRRRRPSAPR